MNMMSLPEIRDLLNSPDTRRLENLAAQAARTTEQYFGRAITLYAPLYLSNYCTSSCVYCGFNSRNPIHRHKLNADEMRREMAKVASWGIENILLLTGESHAATPLSYLLEAVDTAQEYFTAVALEVHPMETQDYRLLAQRGVSGITVYQETYDRLKYREVHPSGEKSDYDYRYRTPERVAQSGMRQITLGVLLGLADDPAGDIEALFQHLGWMERHFPGVEYNLSFPRLRSVHGRNFSFCPVSDETFIKIICLARLSFPRVGISLSTRESPRLRDNALGLGVTRLSAGSNTSVGGYTLEDPEVQDPQFDIDDNRSVHDIVHMLKQRQFDPVFTDWRALNDSQRS